MPCGLVPPNADTFPLSLECGVTDGGAEGAATTPTELQRQRRPSYFAKPVIRAAPVPAAQPDPPAPGTEENGAPETAAPAAAATAAAAPAKKELPPLLRARLAKRGILPQVPPSNQPGIAYVHADFVSWNKLLVSLPGWHIILAREL